MEDSKGSETKKDSDDSRDQGSSQSNLNQSIKKSTTTTNHEKESINKQRRNLPGWIQAVAAIAIVVITSCYTYYAYIQADKMRESVNIAKETTEINKESMQATLKEMKGQSASMEMSAKASEDSAVTSKHSLSLAEKSLKTSIKMSRGDQRAWVGVAEASPPVLKEDSRNVYVKEGEKIDICVTIINSGKTPARKFISKRVISLVPSEVPFVPNYLT